MGLLCYRAGSQTIAYELCYRAGSQTIAYELCFNRTQSNGLSSIEFDCGNRTHTRVGVRFRSIAELNRTQSTDWVRLRSIFERSIYYAGL